MNHDAEEKSAVMLFERNDRLVCEAFSNGDFDFIDAAGELSETDFFRAIASNISMRFHGVHQFNAFPFVVRAGGLVQAFGPKMGHKAVQPETGNITLSCEGFNDKNNYDRETPCDQDYLRKMARRTDADLLHQWFNRDVAGIFKQHHAFDPEGVFIGDGTYLFVPDNDAYEGSVRLLFDEHNHPVDSTKLTKKEQAAYPWRRRYKLVSLIHTNRAGEFFLYAGLRVISGKDHECPLLYELIDDFVRSHGREIGRAHV